MRLSRALGLSSKEVVAFVGAGGKTTAMVRLGAELAAANQRVVLTTTTRIFPPSPGHFDELIVEPDPEKLLRRVVDSLAEHRRVVVAAQYLADEGKLLGINPDQGADLLALDTVDAILVEADGARGQPLKAPAAYKPVIPAVTTLAVIVAGMASIGQPVAIATHRPENVVALTGAGSNDLITPELVARLLAHPQGGLKNVPLTTRVVVLLNQVEAEERLQAARKVAQLLLNWKVEGVEASAGSGPVKAMTPIIGGVALAAVASEDPVREVHRRIAAVVLAAGGSRRFGRPKQLLDWHGQPMVAHVVDKVLECVSSGTGVTEIVVVVGHAAEAVEEALRGRPVRIVFNPDWEQGQSTSMRMGLKALGPEIGAVLFILADQPGLAPAIFERIIQRYRETLVPIVLPTFQGRRGNPVLFDRSLFDELIAIEGDQGGRKLFALYPPEPVEVDDAAVVQDIDTVADYEVMTKSHISTSFIGHWDLDMGHSAGETDGNQ